MNPLNLEIDFSGYGLADCYAIDFESGSTDWVRIAAAKTNKIALIEQVNFLHFVERHLCF
tara:strand:+ start:1031 stop:1210 length:180 start_codon:yes stop_codon:yes gene_type:complete